jgi:hypothetical protein
VWLACGVGKLKIAGERRCFWSHPWFESERKKVKERKKERKKERTK